MFPFASVCGSRRDNAAAVVAARRPDDGDDTPGRFAEGDATSFAVVLLLSVVEREAPPDFRCPCEVDPVFFKVELSFLFIPLKLHNTSVSTCVYTRLGSRVADPDGRVLASLARSSSRN
jgi:hypothetical protein